LTKIQAGSWPPNRGMHVDVPEEILEDDRYAIIVAMGHKPDLCLRCAWALSAFSDHDLPTIENGDLPLGEGDKA